MVNTTRTYSILLYRKDHVQASLTALAKRCARKGLAPLAWTWGKPCNEPHPLHHETSGKRVTVVPLTLEGETPRYAGWTFVAALQHLDGENIVRTLPGEELPPQYRTTGPVCDHCKVNRRRNDTYVVRHDDGRTVQVGSTCVRDFLGSDDAGKIAGLADIMSLARSVAEDDGEEGEGGSGHVPSEWTIEEYFPFVAWCVRVQGWTSRTAARDRGMPATADLAWTYMVNPKARKQAEADPTDADRVMATMAAEWADTLTDSEVDAERGDYLHNLRAVARTGLVSSRTAGIGASAITAYQRAIGKARERAERAARPRLDAHVGTVGKREKFRAVLDFVTGYEGAYGYTTVLKFRTTEGASLVWKASSTDLGRADVGKAFDLVGTVKGHDEYKGEKQTTLSRCKASEVTQ